MVLTKYTGTPIDVVLLVLTVPKHKIKYVADKYIDIWKENKIIMITKSNDRKINIRKMGQLGSDCVFLD